MTASARIAGIDRQRLSGGGVRVGDAADQEGDFGLESQGFGKTGVELEGFRGFREGFVEIVFVEGVLAHEHDRLGTAGIDRQGLVEFGDCLLAVEFLQQQAPFERVRLPGVGVVLERVGAERVDHEIENLRVVVPAGVLDRAAGAQQQAGGVFGLALVVVADEGSIGLVGFVEAARFSRDVGQNEPCEEVFAIDAAGSSASFSASASCPRSRCSSARRASKRGSCGAAASAVTVVFSASSHAPSNCWV